MLSRHFLGITSGSTSPCDVAAFTMTPSFNWILQDLGTGITIHDVRLTVTIVFLSTPYTCFYEGSLSGTRTTGASAVLTITRDALARMPGSAGICTTDPTVTGTLNTDITFA